MSTQTRVIDGAVTDSTATERLQRLAASTRRFRPVLIASIALTVYFSFAQSVFFTLANIENLLIADSALMLVSVGMTFVMISGGFDLSAGAIATLSAVCLSKVITAGMPGYLAVLVAIAFGAVIGGAINGLLIGKAGLSFFVVTLGSMTALTGVVNLWSNAETSFLTDSFINQLARNKAGGVPVPVWIIVVVTLIGLFVLHRTYFGRDVYATGGSSVAARLSGIRTEWVTVSVFAISGACAAGAGILSSARVAAVVPQVDSTLPLNAAAAVLLGGAGLSGGTGGLGGTVFGVLFIGVLQNGLSLSGVPSFWQQVVTGVILILAVLSDHLDIWRRANRLFRIGRRTGRVAVDV